MKKVFLCLIALAFLSCSTDDENSLILNESNLSFNLNGVDYSLTDYNVTLNPANTEIRIIEASFDNNMKTLLFSVLVEETNQIDDFVFIENHINHISDPIYGNRETSIEVHTDSKMEGTFRATMEDNTGQPIFTFTDGVINIEY
ncbi:hypothetical protein IMCC3317_27000 [Kordia antarctica]|uniref:Uncharacterized protein n=1 Tax=Kordia antarctica TaxID=1218801 RepID=A0A7L4ZLE2_9FLAO|nr:hypothetical protein [Kordia antarctica]QHI37321.1 hypothetical protein IMCC3317_27000 [Kordia antarctica]